MASTQKPKKNALSIRLAESAVFLRTDYSKNTRRNSSPSSFSRNGVLRGLLVLDLVKPTKLTRIDVELTSTTNTACPEGIGARRIEINEQHRVYHASTTFFSASAPGKHHHYQQQSDLVASPTQHRRSASIGPGVSYAQHDPEEEDNEEESSSGTLAVSRLSRSASSRVSSRTPTSTNRRGNRPMSVDGSQLGSRSTLSALSIPPPIPPYSLYSPSSEQPSFLSPNLSPSMIPRRPSFTETILEDEPAPNSTNATTTESPIPITLTTTISNQLSIRTEQLQSDDQRERVPSCGLNSSKRFSLAAVSSRFLDVVHSASPGLFLHSHGNERELSPREPSVSSIPVSPSIRGRREREWREGVRESTMGVGEDEEGRNEQDRQITRRKSILAKILGQKAEESEEFPPGTYTYPITFTIPFDAPPTLQADYGSVCWRLKAHVHRPGAFNVKLSAEREVVVVSCPTEEETEDTENIIVERTWEQQLQYLISVSGRAFFIGGTVPVSMVLMPLEKVKVHRIMIYIEEKVEYYSHFQRLVRCDPPLRFYLLSLRHEGKTPTSILPLDSSSQDILRSSPLFQLLEPEQQNDPNELGELAASLMGPGPWTFHKDLKLPAGCDQMKFTNKNLRANVKVGHMLKVVMRLEKGTGSEVSLSKKKPALFDIVVQTPVVILSCRCDPQWYSLPRYTEVFDGISHGITRACPCQARRYSFNDQSHQHPNSSSSSPATSSAESLASSSARRATPDEPPLASTNSPSSSPTSQHGPRNGYNAHLAYAESILRSSSLFERLVSGQESETGEAPPAYDHLCHGGSGDAQGPTLVAVKEVQVVGTGRGRRRRDSLVVASPVVAIF